MALLATSGRDWSDRTKRQAARVPELSIFSQGHVVREHGGWRITDKGRAVLELMEARPAAVEQVEATAAEPSDGAIPPLPQPAERARRRTRGAPPPSRQATRDGDGLAARDRLERRGARRRRRTPT